VPADFNDRADLMGLGGYHTCLAKTGLLTCFGNNEIGQTDVPDHFTDGADLMGLG